MSQHQRIDADKTKKTSDKHRQQAEKTASVVERSSATAMNEVGVVSGHAAENHSAWLMNARSPVERQQIALQLQRTYGNAYVQRLLGSRTVQARLSVSKPGDPAEQEADRMADAVTRNLSRQVQRQADEEEEPVQMKVMREEEEEEELQMKVMRQEEEEELQMMAQRQEEKEEDEEELVLTSMQEKDEIARSHPADNLEDRINAQKGGGQSLSGAVRSVLEPQFGYDFSQVRVHADHEADDLSRQLHAEAFATGRDIFFRQGKFQPDSDQGRWLLSHELTHVVQQGGGRVSPHPADTALSSAPHTSGVFVKKEEKKSSDQDSSSGKEEVKEPYENKPLAGMDKVTYDKAVAKFKQMKKPRLLGGSSKAMRRLDALKYLRETVENSKKYTSETQMIVNSVMEAYKDVFGVDLKYDKAAEKLGDGKQEEFSKFQKFKTFVSSIFSIKSWISWAKEFINFVKNPTEAGGETMGLTLPKFLSFAQPIADKIAGWLKWLPIVGIVTSIFSLIKSVYDTISRFGDMMALKAVAQKDEKASGDLAEAARYGYAKVNRGFWGRLLGMFKGVGDLILSVAKLVVGLFSGGIGAAVVQAIELSMTLIDLVVTLAKKWKGLLKWLLGIRGKARRENAEKIIMAAKQGSVEAIELIVKLAPGSFTRGGKLDKARDWLIYWGKQKKAHDKQMLIDILRDWDRKEIDNLVNVLADKLKSS